mmetsp:Transcript_1272/g.3165  ORF Transcript_1272/g.3165 Transcript_1272/m.3165 type:complete len:318 (-) Transcript_1272:1065-2018(-)
MKTCIPLLCISLFVHPTQHHAQHSLLSRSINLPLSVCAAWEMGKSNANRECAFPTTNFLLREILVPRSILLHPLHVLPLDQALDSLFDIRARRREFQLGHDLPDQSPVIDHFPGLHDPHHGGVDEVEAVLGHGSVGLGAFLRRFLHGDVRDPYPTLVRGEGGVEEEAIVGTHVASHALLPLDLRGRGRFALGGRLGRRGVRFGGRVVIDLLQHPCPVPPHAQRLQHPFEFGPVLDSGPLPDLVEGQPSSVLAILLPKAQQDQALANVHDQLLGCHTLGKGGLYDAVPQRVLPSDAPSLVLVVVIGLELRAQRQELGG